VTTRGGAGAYLVVRRFRIFPSRFPRASDQLDQTAEPAATADGQQQRGQPGRQILGVLEPFGEKNGFRDEPAVRHCHGHRAERRSQAVGQVGTVPAATAAGTRRDEQTASGRQRDGVVPDEQRFRVGRQRREHRQHVLRGGRQYFGSPPTDPVETTPSSLLREPLKREHARSLLVSVRDTAVSENVYPKIRDRQRGSPTSRNSPPRPRIAPNVSPSP